MKRKILAICAAILVASFLLAGALAEGPFDGLENVVIITPNGAQEANSAPSAESRSGLALTLGEGSVAKDGDARARISLDVELMNWDMESHDLEDSIGAKLYYQDAYAFEGTFDFGDDDEIDMLVRLNGTLRFSVPDIVARAGDEELRLEITVLSDTYDEALPTLDLPESLSGADMPFDYGTRESDALELRLGDASIQQEHDGVSDEKYKWLIQDFSVINWSNEERDLEDAASLMLLYANQYGFQAEVEYGQESIAPLEIVRCQAVFHVPNVVTEDAAGMLALRITLNGEETEQDYDLTEAMARTAYLSKYDMALNYWYGDGVKQDREQALELFKQIFKDLKNDYDDPTGERQRVLGRLYEDGWGTEQDLDRARELYEESTALGNTKGMVNLGYLYDNGKGVDQDYARALELYEQAAALGDASAIFNLALMYCDGTGVEQDYTRGRELLEQAVALGNVDAMFNLALMYCEGMGVEQDYTRARELFEQAAALGDAGSINNLGNIYYCGYGVEIDYERARELFEQAAALGNVNALGNLGNLYENGYGVKQDHARAQEYFAAYEAATAN